MGRLYIQPTNQYFQSAMLLLRPLANSRLWINVDASSQENNVSVNLLGEDVHIINDVEASEFGLDDEELREACADDDDEEIPTNVYLHSPIPDGDQAEDGWTEVHRKLKPVKASILGIRKKPTIIASQLFRNNSTKTAEYKAELSQSVTNTVTNSWDLRHTMNVGLSITVEIGVPLTKNKIGGTASISFEHQWGQSHSESQEVNIGAVAGLTVPVSYGDSVEVFMTASQGNMEIEVVYEASLYGDVVAFYENFDSQYQYYDVNDLMEKASLPLTLQVTEILKVNYYTDVEIVLHEKRGYRVLKADISF